MKNIEQRHNQSYLCSYCYKYMLHRLFRMLF
nr:MAG TPA: REFINED LARGE RIBOSOMAL SUBUNIT (50S) ASSEMBLY, RNA-RNA, PROTEIN-RNA, PROTEIN-PROTEIN [Caudoviricetes sp.]